MRFIGVEKEQETSASPPKKILDPPLSFRQKVFNSPALSEREAKYVSCV